MAETKREEGRCIGGSRGQRSTIGGTSKGMEVTKDKDTDEKRRHTSTEALVETLCFVNTRTQSTTDRQKTKKRAETKRERETCVGAE